MNGTYLEYIESTGTQYIDTEYIANSNTRIVFEGAPLLLSNVSPGSFFIGDAYPNYTDSGREFFIYSNDLQYYTVQAVFNGQVLFASKKLGQIFTGDDIKVDFNSNRLKVLKNDTVVCDHEFVYQDNSSNSSLKIFKLSRSENVNYYGKVRIYYLKIYEQDILQKYFIPYKTENNDVGMYDVVHKKFYNNLGAGSFSAGPEKTMPDLIEDDRILSCSNIYYYCMNNFFLPMEYDQLEYIQTSGTQYIDTGLVALHGFHAIADLEILDDMSVSSYHKCIIGAHGDAPNYRRNFFSFHQNMLWFGAGDSAGSFQGTYNGQRHIYDFSNKYDDIHLKVDGLDKAYSLVGGSQPNDSYNNLTLYVFYGHSTEKTQHFLKLSAKLYSLSIESYEGDTCYFVPAKRKSDNVIGLYDIIHRIFRTNIGTGNFLEGPTVPRLSNFGDRSASVEYANILMNKIFAKRNQSPQLNNNLLTNGKRIISASIFKKLILKYFNNT